MGRDGQSHHRTGRGKPAGFRVFRAFTVFLLGAIAVAYVEWAGIEFQRVTLPWQRIAGVPFGSIPDCLAA